MSQLKCERVGEGMRNSERLVVLRDAGNRLDYVRVESDFLTQQQDTFFLPVWVLGQDDGKGLVLVELPLESEAGNNRLWVNRDLVVP